MQSDTNLPRAAGVTGATMAGDVSPPVMVDHRALLKKLMLQEFDLLGENQTLRCVTEDGTSGYVQFTDAEKAEIRIIVDEAHVDWLVARNTPDGATMAGNVIEMPPPMPQSDPGDEDQPAAPTEPPQAPSESPCAPTETPATERQLFAWLPFAPSLR